MPSPFHAYFLETDDEATIEFWIRAFDAKVEFPEDFAGASLNALGARHRRVIGSSPIGGAAPSWGGDHKLGLPLRDRRPVDELPTTGGGVAAEFPADRSTEIARVPATVHERLEV